MIIVHKVDGAWVRFAGTPHLNTSKIIALVQSGVWDASDLEAHQIKVAAPFVVPTGKEIIGAESFQESSGAVAQIFSVRDVSPPTRAELHEAVTAKRRTLANGAALVNTGQRTIPVWVDPESLGAITGLVIASEIIADLAASWKGADGSFYQIVAAEMKPMALAMMTYVQSCFATEAAVHAAIDADRVTTVAGAIGFDGWPEPYEVA